jgi:hypothetical protein
MLVLPVLEMVCSFPTVEEWSGVDCFRIRLIQSLRHIVNKHAPKLEMKVTAIVSVIHPPYSLSRSDWIIGTHYHAA